MCTYIHKCPNTNVEVRGQLGALAPPHVGPGDWPHSA